MITYCEYAASLKEINMSPKKQHDEEHEQILREMADRSASICMSMMCIKFAMSEWREGTE